jgi:hypothetical protein
LLGEGLEKIHESGTDEPTKRFNESRSLAPKTLARVPGA